MQAFYGHGLCSTHRWIVSATTSDTEQGHGHGLVGDGIFNNNNIGHQNDFKGSWHANNDGQKAIAQILYKSLSGSVLGTDGYKLPSIAITSPANGSSVTAGQPVQLSAAASGYDNDPVTVQWTDSATGALGTGPTITTTFDSSHANHLLTATAKDLISGQTAAASLVLTVQNPPTFPLTLNIHSALNGENVTTADGRNQCNGVYLNEETCTFDYPPGATVTLTAHVNGVWNGYWGAGPGTPCYNDEQPTCTVVMSGPETVDVDLHGFN